MNLSTILTIITVILIGALAGRAKYMNGNSSSEAETVSSDSKKSSSSGAVLSRAEEQKKEHFSKQLDDDEQIETIANVSKTAMNRLEQFVATTNKGILVSDENGYEHKYSYDELKSVKIVNGAGMKTSDPETAYMITVKATTGRKYCFIKGSRSFVPLANSLMQRF